MSYKRHFLLGLFVFLPLCCFAEIQEIMIRFNPGVCNRNCPAFLQETMLKRVPAIKEIRMNATEGRMDMVWRPNAPYNYQTIDYAMRWVGLSILEMRMKVQGKMSHNGDNFFLTSTGDNTNIQLFSQIKPSENLYVERNNISAYTVDEAVRAKMLDAEKNNLLVFAEGQVLMPWRYLTPPVLILSNFKFVNEEEK